LDFLALDDEFFLERCFGLLSTGNTSCCFVLGDDFYRVLTILNIN
jgi:hypothetical protein